MDIIERTIVAASGERGSRNRLQERYLKYRHYYAGIDISGFGGYGKAVYSRLFPVFDVCFERKYVDDIPLNLDLLEDRSYLIDHPDYREERGGVITYHIKVLALSMIGVILNENKKVISRQLLKYIICDVSRNTQSCDFSDRMCFAITVRMFIDMLKEHFAHLGSPVTELSLHDFANGDTLNPKPQHSISVL